MTVSEQQLELSTLDDAEAILVELERHTDARTRTDVLFKLIPYQELYDDAQRLRLVDIVDMTQMSLRAKAALVECLYLDEAAGGGWLEQINNDILDRECFVEYGDDFDYDRNNEIDLGERKAGYQLVTEKVFDDSLIHEDPEMAERYNMRGMQIAETIIEGAKALQDFQRQMSFSREEGLTPSILDAKECAAALGEWRKALEGLPEEHRGLALATLQQATHELWKGYIPEGPELYNIKDPELDRELIAVTVAFLDTNAFDPRHAIEMAESCLNNREEQPAEYQQLADALSFDPNSPSSMQKASRLLAQLRFDTERAPTVEATLGAKAHRPRMAFGALAQQEKDAAVPKRSKQSKRMAQWHVATAKNDGATWLAKRVGKSNVEIMPPTGMMSGRVSATIGVKQFLNLAEFKEIASPDLIQQRIAQRQHMIELQKSPPTYTFSGMADASYKLRQKQKGLELGVVRAGDRIKGVMSVEHVSLAGKAAQLVYNKEENKGWFIPAGACPGAKRGDRLVFERTEQGFEFRQIERETAKGLDLTFDSPASAQNYFAQKGLDLARLTDKAPRFEGKIGSETVSIGGRAAHVIHGAEHVMLVAKEDHPGMLVGRGVALERGPRGVPEVAQLEPLPALELGEGTFAFESPAALQATLADHHLKLEKFDLGSDFRGIVDAQAIQVGSHNARLVVNHETLEARLIPATLLDSFDEQNIDRTQEIHIMRTPQGYSTKQSLEHAHEQESEQDLER